MDESRTAHLCVTEGRAYVGPRHCTRSGHLQGWLIRFVLVARAALPDGSSTTPESKSASARFCDFLFLILGAGVTPAARRAGDYFFPLL